MGRKSSAKALTRAPGPPQASPPSRPFSPLLIVALLAVALAVGGFIYARSGRGQADAKQQNPQQAAPPPVAEVPEVARKPHPQKTLPPLPVQAYAPPRPP